MNIQEQIMHQKLQDELEKLLELRRLVLAWNQAIQNLDGIYKAECEIRKWIEQEQTK